MTAELQARLQVQRSISAESVGCSLSCPIFSKFSTLTCVSHHEDFRLSRHARNESIACGEFGTKLLLAHDDGIHFPAQLASADMPQRRRRLGDGHLPRSDARHWRHFRHGYFHRSREIQQRGQIHALSEPWRGSAWAAAYERLR
jgi:hypothetical protein